MVPTLQPSWTFQGIFFSEICMMFNDKVHIQKALYLDLQTMVFSCFSPMHFVKHCTLHEWETSNSFYSQNPCVQTQCYQPWFKAIRRLLRLQRLFKAMWWLPIVASSKQEAEEKVGFKTKCSSCADMKQKWVLCKGPGVGESTRFLLILDKNLWTCYLLMFFVRFISSNNYQEQIQ